MKSSMVPPYLHKDQSLKCRDVLLVCPAEGKMVPALASVWHQGELRTVASGFHVTAPGVAE